MAADIWPEVDTRLEAESVLATTAVADNTAVAEVDEDTVEVATEEATVAAATEEDEEPAAVTALTALTVLTTLTTPLAVTLLLLVLRDEDIGAFAGGGRLLTKGLLLSRSARR